MTSALSNNLKRRGRPGPPGRYRRCSVSRRRIDPRPVYFEVAPEVSSVPGVVKNVAWSFSGRAPDRPSVPCGRSEREALAGPALPTLRAMSGRASTVIGIPRLLSGTPARFCAAR